MKRFGDDILYLILKWVNNPDDRKSFSQVCKQWLRVEGLSRLCLSVFEPHLIPNFLPRFPNLVMLQSTKVITNAGIQFMAKTCPELKILNLNYRGARHGCDEFKDILGPNDLDDLGLWAVANGCSKLSEVYLRKRCWVGDFGVISLVDSLENLCHLDLGRCIEITDEALKAIGSSNSLRVLNLKGCWKITDEGLASLAKGSLSWFLKKLVLADCDRITDKGLLHLREFCCLQELDLAECGPKVTDKGGLAIAEVETLKRLNLSWLVNISDVTLVALAQGCLYLEALDLTGCEYITGDGILAFVNHKSLREIVLACCLEYPMKTLEELVLGCENLRHIVVDKRLRMWIPTPILANIDNSFCRLVWL